MSKKVIMLSGKRNSGKTTVANLMKDILVGPVTIYPMASMLKRIVAAIDNINPANLDDPEFKKKDSNYTVDRYGMLEKLTYRKLLLHFGKKIRYDDDKIFIRDVLHKIENVVNGFIIIPDIREKQELESIWNYCNNNNIECIAIRIIDKSNKPELYFDSTMFDKTECDLDDYHFSEYILNYKISKSELINGIKSSLSQFVTEFKNNPIEQELL